MASLKRPDKCKCGSEFMSRKSKPERWICNACNDVVVSRPERITNSNTCLKCGKSRDEIAFRKNKNICVECHSKYNADYRGKNFASLKEYRHNYFQLLDKRIRSDRVRKCNQRSPEAFIRNLMHNLTKIKNLKQRYKADDVRIDCDFDHEYLMDLWVKQNGVCALSGINMVYEFHNLLSISVDRINSKLGHIRGNVQLVCKWVNMAKSTHSNEEMTEILRMIRVPNVEIEYVI